MVSKKKSNRLIDFVQDKAGKLMQKTLEDTRIDMKLGKDTLILTATDKSRDKIIAQVIKKVVLIIE